MPTYSLTIGTEGGIRWPNKCTVCGEAATCYGTARCAVVTKLAYRIIYWSYTSRILSIQYPLCLKHRALRFLPSLLSRRNLFNLGLGFLVCFFFAFGALMPALAWLLDGAPIHDPRLVLTWTLLFAAGLGVFFLSKHLTPVRINSVNDQALVISIANPRYASEFEVANNERIIAKDGYALRR